MKKHFNLSEPVQISFKSSFTKDNKNNSSAKPNCSMYVFGRNSYNYQIIFSFSLLHIQDFIDNLP